MEGPIHHLFDKRVQKPIVYRVGDLGEDITMLEILTYRVGKCQLRFYKPNPISIFLSSSDRELKLAKDIYKSLVQTKLIKREKFELSEPDTILLYDYLEHIQASIVMAFTAVECLANELIPADFKFKKKNKDGIIEEYDKTNIERWVSTIDKYAFVLPAALGVTKPTTYNFWPKFTKLKDLRNDIIHSNSKLPIEQEEKERIFSLLLSDSVFGKIKSASELIRKIQSEVQSHAKMPILNETETINPLEIPNWESLGVTRID